MTIKTLARECTRQLGILGLVRLARALKKWMAWTPYDQQLLGFYLNFFQPGGLVFDIGANIGMLTKVFIKGGAIVIAVEPQIECVKVLKIAKSLIAGARLKIEQKAVAPKKGYMEMYICNSNTLSSLSLNWIKAVKNSGRFSGYVWSEKRLIETTTLDELIEKYGIPQFIKIDVEGYEEEAIKGLSRPVPALSLEFTPEYRDSAIRCIEYLEKIGNIRLNYTLGEIPKLELEKWISPDEMIKKLKNLEGDNKLYGNIYVRFSN